MIPLESHCTGLCLVAQLCLTLCNPMDYSLPGSSAHGIFQARTLGTVVCQAPLSIGLSRQEFWSELPCPPPRDLPNPGIEPGSPALEADSLPPEPPGKPYISVYICHTHIYIHIYTERERERSTGTQWIILLSSPAFSFYSEYPSIHFMCHLTRFLPYVSSLILPFSLSRAKLSFYQVLTDITLASELSDVTYKKL